VATASFTLAGGKWESMGWVLEVIDLEGNIFVRGL
jgi:hypothetical protein